MWNFVLMCANVSDLISQSILVTGDDRRNEKVKHFAGGTAVAVILLNAESVCEITTKKRSTSFLPESPAGWNSITFPLQRLKKC